MKRLCLSGLLLVSLLIATGCSRGFGESIKQSEGAVKSASSAEVVALMEKGDAAWEQRADRVQATAAAQAYAKAAALASESYEVLYKACHSHYWLADSFYNDPDEEDKKLATHEKGLTYCEMAMATDPDFKKAIEEGATVEEAAANLPKSHLGAVYWAASNLGKWAVTKGFAAILGNKNKIKGLYEVVEGMDPQYFYGAPMRSLGTVYAKAPAFAGGDMNKSKEYFEKAYEIEKNYFGTHVLQAEFYCVKLKAEEGGRSCFKEHLNYVLDTPVDVIPELIPENTIEKRKAERLLEQIDEKFSYSDEEEAEAMKEAGGS